MAVEIAIGIVIDGATGRAHQHRAGGENSDEFPIGPPSTGNPERAQGGPEQ